jgi:hypothetical protein
MGYQNQPQFTFNQQRGFTAPTYQPGANPFQMPTQQTAVPSNVFNAQQFTGQTQVQRTPNAYQPVAAPLAGRVDPFRSQVAQNPVNAQLQNSIAQALANPSAYNSDAVMSTYDRLNRRLGQDYNAQYQQISEEMARRGLYDSTIASGRYGDLATNQAQAQSDLAAQLLEGQARTYGQDRASAQSMGLGYQNQGFGNELAAYQANMAAGQQNFNQDLASRAFQGDQNAQLVLSQLQAGQFGANENQRMFQNQMAQNQLNNQYGQQNWQNQMERAALQDQMANSLYNRQMGVGQFNQGLGNMNFQNQLAGAQFREGQYGTDFSNALAGYNTNLGAYGQDWAQRQQALNTLLGYGQQQFSNQLASYQTNRDTDLANQELMLRMMGYL